MIENFASFEGFVWGRYGVFDYVNKFGWNRKYGKKNHVQRPRPSSTADNIRAICDLIQDDQWVAVDEIASTMGELIASSQNILDSDKPFPDEIQDC